MSCLLCEKPGLVFGNYIAPYCIVHNSEEISRECPTCHNTSIIRRGSDRCKNCSTFSFTSNTTTSYITTSPIVVPVVYFMPKNENRDQIIK